MDFKMFKIFGFMVSIIFLYLAVTVFVGTKLSNIAVSLSVISAAAPFFAEIVYKNQKEQNLINKFTDFIRDLVSTVKSGMPIPQAIVFVSKDEYGSLTGHVRYLANKITWGISLRKALLLFGQSTGIKSIKRHIDIILQAEKSGGYIEDVLDNVVDTLRLNKRIREKRKSAIQSQIGQSYVIFMIFLVVLVVIQNYLAPFMTSVNDESSYASPEDAQKAAALKELFSPVMIEFSSIPVFITSTFEWFSSVDGIFTALSLIQGLFNGLVLGQLAEGSPKAGAKHSFIMMCIGLVVLSIF